MMDRERRINARAYKHYLLGVLSLFLGNSYKVKMIEDIDGNPGHLEVEIPGEVTLQILIKTIPEEPGAPDIGDPAQTTT